MSGDAWFAQYERLQSENPTATEDELCDMAEEALIDNMSSAADAISDEVDCLGCRVFPSHKH